VDKWISARSPCRASLFGPLGRWKSRWTNEDKTWKSEAAGNILAAFSFSIPRIFSPAFFCASFLPKYSPKCALLGGPKGLSTLSPFALSTKSGRKKHGKSRLFNSVHKLCTMLSTVLGSLCAGGCIRVSCEKCENSRTNHYTTDGRKKKYVREKVTKEGRQSKEALES